MSELIDRIPGVQSTIATMRGVIDTTNQIKARQRITGRSGQLAYAVSSSADWDLMLTFPAAPPPAYLSATFTIVFTGDGSQKFPIAVPITDMRVNGTADANKLSYPPGVAQLEYHSGSNDVLAQTFERPAPDYFDSELQQAWTIDILYRGNITVYIKVRAQATSDGTITVTRTT